MRSPRPVAALVALVALAAPSSLAAQRPAAARIATPPIDLVVLVAVDQLRPDYFDRWPGQLDGGLARLRARGTLFPHGAQDHALTETAPGHATLLSGRVPARTRIWSNDGGVESGDFPLVGGPVLDEDGVPAGASPVRFAGTTLHDWLRAVDPGARALSVSRKDRAAILPIGRARAHVYWYARGRFTTSSYYADTLPAWVAAFNARHRPGDWAGRAWTLARAESLYAEPDDQPWENRGRERTFPHRLPTALATAADSLELADRLERVPWMDSLTLDLALAGVRALDLGRRPGARAPDLLSVSLSTLDAIGHDFGPESRELHDHVLRLDRWLGAFLDTLAAHVPAERTLLVLTADHGVSPTPEWLRARGRPGGRIDLTGLTDSAGAALRARWNVDFRLAFDNGLLAADVAALRARGVDVDALAATLAAAARRHAGVRRAFTPRTLAAAPAGDADVGRWRRSLPRELGWLVAATADDGWVFADEVRGQHGTMALASREVPIVFAGPGIPARTDRRPVRTVDIAATLAALLGVRPTEPLDGRAIPGVRPGRGRPGRGPAAARRLTSGHGRRHPGGAAGSPAGASGAPPAAGGPGGR